MVYLKVIGSSSSGNCYILQTAHSKERLIIECGVKWTDIAKGLNFEYPSGVSGCIISHSHGDHSKSIEDVLRNGIDIYALESVFTAKNIKVDKIPYTKKITPQKAFSVGNFTILPLIVNHDVECVAYVIKHKEMGSLLFCTDTNEFKYIINGLNHILIEANYSKKILKDNVDSGKVPKILQARLGKTHMAIDTAIDTLKAMDLSKVYTLCLIHLSYGNSNAEEFSNKVTEELAIKPIIADKGLEITLMNGDFE